MKTLEELTPTLNLLSTGITRIFELVNENVELESVLKLLVGESNKNSIIEKFKTDLTDIESILKFVEDRKITLYLSTKELDNYISYLRGDEGRIINLPKENVNYDKVHLISTSEIIKTDLYVVCNSQTNLILHRLNNEMTAITPPCEIFKLK